MSNSIENNSLIIGSILALPDRESFCAPISAHQLTPMTDTRTKPVIKVSYIGPQSSEVMEAVESIFANHPAKFLFKMFMKSVEVNPRNYFEFRQPIQCNVDKIAYNELSTRYSVTGLAFHIIGHGFTKMDWQHNFSCYEKTVVDINFSGHLSYITPAFQIISQLKSLKKVTVSVGFSQHPFFLETTDKDYKNFTVLPNSNVKALSVKVNSKVFSRGSDLEKKIIDNMMEILFRRAEECLPNLSQLDLQLPATNITEELYKKVIHNCKFNVGESLILNFDVLAVLGMVHCQYVLVSSEASQKRTILQSPIVPFHPHLIKNSIDDKFQSDLEAMNDKVKKTFVSLRNLAMSRFVPTLMESGERYPALPADEPPPGFEYLYNIVRIGSVHNRSPLLTPGSYVVSEEIDEVLRNISRNQQAIERNQARITMMRNIEYFRENRLNRIMFLNDFDTMIPSAFARDWESRRRLWLEHNNNRNNNNLNNNNNC